MLTASLILEKQLKAGLGYDKKEVEQFLHDISSDYNALQTENADLKNKTKELTESLNYYKSIEKTLQKALILAEKTAQDTRATALREADVTLLEAKVKANMLIADSRKQIELMEHKAFNLKQQYDIFKIQFGNMLHAQVELLQSNSFSINTEEFTYQAAFEEKEGAFKHLDEAELSKSLRVSLEETALASSEVIDNNQLQFDFLKNQLEIKSYQTEDGFEFFTMKDE
ncbi:MAG TPA: DivIVA domain-containing protein [Mobilitalea sp.]|nr:DivIVA domain-containing protein [Mobilitalea sp.]